MAAIRQLLLQASLVPVGAATATDRQGRAQAVAPKAGVR